MAQNPCLLRPATAADYPALGRLMFAAVQADPSPYSPAQRTAWMPAPPEGAGWAARLGAQQVVLAEQGDLLLGFMTLAPDGLIDLAFIHPLGRGRGLLARLFAPLQDSALSQGVTRLHCFASLMAQGPFRRLGFQLQHHEVVERAGQQLRRAAMVKDLHAPGDAAP